MLESASSGPVASGMGASSASSDASVITHSTGSSGEGSGSISVSRTSRQRRAARRPLQQPRGNRRRYGHAIDAIR